MVFYLGIGVLLWIFAVSGLFIKTKSGLSVVISFCVFWAICSFRFETGYDWMVYEAYFNAVSSLGFWEMPQDVVPMEPMFYIINYLISRVGSFQFFLFVVGCFNTYCAFRFFKQFNVRISLGAAFVFCWVFFPLEMGTIRQSIAVSFMLLAMEGFVFGRKRLGALSFLLAVSFQYSAVMYTFIFFSRAVGFLYKRIWIFIAACLAFYFLSSGIGNIALSLGSVASIPFISDKLIIYAGVGVSQKSIAGAGYLLLNCILLGLAKFYIKEVGRRESVLIGALICLVGAQSFFFDFALIWNRIQYLACFAQIAVIYSILMSMRMLDRAVMTIGVSAVSLAALFLFVSSPGAVPFIPYRSYFETAVTGKAGDGRERSIQYYKIFNEQNK